MSPTKMGKKCFTYLFFLIVIVLIGCIENVVDVMYVCFLLFTYVRILLLNRN